MKIITRIAPSPSGPLHIGTARSALFNYLFARANGGVFNLRIEDTDRSRSREEHEKDIIDSLTWLGLAWDNFYRQSDHLEEHSSSIMTLLANDKAYLSKEQGRGKQEVVRLRNPGSVVTFVDMVRGEIRTDTTDLGDFVIARSVDDPLYHLAVVVDDRVSGVTHIIRGDDHIANTPRQILIQEALGYSRPLYAHIPLILAPNRSKLSKRRGATAIRDFRERGFLPEAMVNYLALLGWSPGGERERYSLDELVGLFDIERIQKSGAVYDEEKLRWFNRAYLQEIPKNEFTQRVRSCLPERLRSLEMCTDERIGRMLPILKERAATFGDIRDAAERGEYDYFFERPAYDPSRLPWKEEAPKATGGHIEYVINKIDAHFPETLEENALKEALMPYADREGRGAVLWPMRMALSGKDASPNPFELATVFGKKETLIRLRNAVQALKESP